MNHIKSVIFDLDNTILDRTGTFCNFSNRFLKVYFSHLASTQEILDRMVYLDQDGYKDRNVLFSELIHELPWKVTPSMAELSDFYKREYVRGAILMDRAEEVLLHVRKKYKTGLITNGRTATQYGKIDRTGIRSFFDVMIVSEEAGVKKPDTRIFEMAVNKLGTKSEECIYIGDHPENDIEGAANAGMATIWITGNHSWKKGLRATPLHTIHTFSELLTLL